MSNAKPRKNHASGGGVASLSLEEAHRLVHELRVHQVELEMQNEEVRSTRCELERALEKYADFYDFAPVGYLALDGQGRVLAANLTAAVMLRVERSCLVGRTIESFIAAEGRASVQSMVAEVFERRVKGMCEVRIKEHVQAHYVRIEAAISRCGEECRAVLIDISEHRRLEEEIRQLNGDLERRVSLRTAELEAALREQESFSYTVSHDLRGPLRHINSYTAILKEEFQGTLPAGAEGYLDRVGHLTRHMGELIDNLLKLSQIGRSELLEEEVDVSGIALEIAALLRESEPDRRVAFEVEPQIKVRADKALLWLVVENLLTNAWKYTSRREDARIELKSSRQGPATVVQVRDNGVGFDMAYRGQLFGVFQRLHGNDYPGLGIGLATVKRIIERHGGQVWAESVVGEGTSFYFTVASERPVPTDSRAA